MPDLLKTLPDARTKAEKEDVSGETRTYGNPIQKSDQYVRTDASFTRTYVKKRVKFVVDSLEMC